MTNIQALALNEFMKKNAPPEAEILEKYSITKSELWSAYAMLKAKAPK